MPIPGSAFDPLYSIKASFNLNMVGAISVTVLPFLLLVNVPAVTGVFWHGEHQLYHYPFAVCILATLKYKVSTSSLSL